MSDPARILLIDDDPTLVDVVSMLLEDEGFIVTTAGDGRAGLAAVLACAPDLIIADVNMPGLDGFSLCRRLRARGATMPIVLLTSRDGEIDEALGLELGADDYVRKPFASRVLIARLNALLRRQTRHAAGRTQGLLHLDPERLAVSYAGQPVDVTVTEFRLLVALTDHPGAVLSRARLLDRMRGDDSVVGERIVDTYVRRLRRMFESVDPTFAAIETVIGAGYRWAERS